MKKSVFDYADYKDYLQHWLLSQENAGHGRRSALARALGCQTAYVSQVLRGGAHFSPEQAEGVSQFLGHDDAEGDYFLLLVQFARAGTEPLRRRLAAHMEATQKKRILLKERLGVGQPLTEAVQVRYFSSWHYAAIHLLVTIPELRTKEKIQARLGLSRKVTNEALEFLTGASLLTKEGNEYNAGSTRIHLGNDAAILLKHHANWRMRALLALEKEEDTDLHYSSVVTVSRDDMRRIRETLAKTIETIKPVIKQSHEEEICSFCIDFFRL